MCDTSYDNMVVLVRVYALLTTTVLSVTVCTLLAGPSGRAVVAGMAGSDRAMGLDVYLL